MRYEFFIAGILCFVALPSRYAESAEPPAEGVLRVATYNVSMYRDREGQLGEELQTGNSRQAKQIAEVLQRVRPHIVLLNEFDYEEDADAVMAFREKYLASAQPGLSALNYRYVFYKPVNTGLDSGLDLDKDGKLGGPADAWGFGRYPGQYGMLLLTQYPIAESESWTYRDLLWREIESPNWPVDPATGKDYYTEKQRHVMRLPSKSFWDVSIALPAYGNRRRLRLLCSHPTPPVFDGPEDRNGQRNFDEIRLVANYISKRGQLIFHEDSYEGVTGMPKDASFIVLGDLNADPVDGGGRPGAIQQLLEHPAVNATFVPKSTGGIAASEIRSDLNASQKGNPAHDTADFGGDGHGNLRVDYVLPSKDLKILGSGVFWPTQNEPGAEATKATDHRLVWIDIEL